MSDTVLPAVTGLIGVVAGGGITLLGNYTLAKKAERVAIQGKHSQATKEYVRATISVLRNLEETHDKLCELRILPSQPNCLS